MKMIMAFILLMAAVFVLFLVYVSTSYAANGTFYPIQCPEGWNEIVDARGPYCVDLRRPEQRGIGPMDYSTYGYPETGVQMPQAAQDYLRRSNPCYAGQCHEDK